MKSEENNWIKRNITDTNKMEEIIGLYESLGFEVRMEDFDAEMYPIDCNECMKEAPEKFKIIYTKGIGNADEDWFDE